MQRIVVSDTTPVSSLLKIGRLNLLKALYQEVVIPPDVYHELNQPDEFKTIDHEEFGILLSEPPNAQLVEQLMVHVHKGEAAAIAYAIEHTPGLLLIDELAGRQLAAQHNLRTIGTAGILPEAKAAGLIPQVRKESDRLRSINFYLSQALYQRIIELAAEL